MMQTISNEAARSFLVSYQALNGCGSLEGCEGVRGYMRRVRCIQFDPLNVVGRNPDLVLQARVRDYRAGILEDLLYRDRFLMDGVDPKPVKKEVKQDHDGRNGEGYAEGKSY